MSKIVYDAQLMQTMALFERLTGAELKDCVSEENLFLFIVQPNEAGKGIGKAGRNVQRLEKALKRKVKIVEFSENVGTFIKNLFYPSKIREVKQEEDVFTVIPGDSRSRGMMIGPRAQTLRMMEKVAKRYYPIKEIKINKW
jgi:transcription termination/antitermination protein NusA